jgi:hypothetical protein
MELKALVRFAQEIGRDLPAAEETEIDREEAAFGDEPLPDLGNDHGPFGAPGWIDEATATVLVPGLDSVHLPEDGPFTYPQTDALPNTRRPIEEALAFYRPYHSYSQWGIFLRESGVLALARGISVAEPGPSDVEAAYRVLLEHEYFHCLTESAATRAEVVALRRIYQPYARSPYSSALEESVGNAHAIRRASVSDQGHIERIGSWMETQPPQYREFERWRSQLGFDRGRETIGRLILRHSGRSPTRLRAPTGFLFRRVSKSGIPTFLVHDLHPQILGVTRAFPKAYGIRIDVHSNDHPPRHVHAQIPIGSKSIQLSWPDLEPLKGNRALTRRERDRVDAYVQQFGRSIAVRVNQVYGP